MESKSTNSISLPHLLLLSGFVIGFIVLKIKHLFLPYFWDEAWSYFPAIQKMSELGPSLLPGSIDPALYRGHPLLFYGLASSWRTIVGSDIAAMRLLPMLLSFALLLVLYRFGKHHFSQGTAATCVVLFGIQSVFLAQSSFLLPEVMVALLTLLCIGSHFAGKQWAACLWLSLLLLTKESGVVLWMALAWWELVEAAQKKQLFHFKSLLTRLWPLVLSAIPVGLFFLCQKIRLGWVLFPEHVGYLVFDVGAVLGKLKDILAYLFIDMGRNLVTILGGASLVFLMVKKIAIASDALRLLYFCVFFTLLYALFSAANFYTPRYLLSVMTLTILGLVFAIETALTNLSKTRAPKLSWLLPLAIWMLLFVNNLVFTFGKIRGNDHNLGFSDVVKSHQAMVIFLEQAHAQDQSVAAGFLTETNLGNPGLGYLTQGKPFRKVTNAVGEETAFAVVTSTEADAILLESIQRRNGKLLKRVAIGNAWAEVYGFGR